MPFSIHEASIPAFVRMLGAMKAILDKAEAHVAARKIDPEALTSFRLYPDMFNFARQVQLATDFAKGAGARLAGLPVPKYEDTEKTFPELRARIDKTIAFLEGIGKEALDGAEAREVTLRVGGADRTFKGADYLVNFALPNFYFHLTTAYDILRHNGVEIGKRDFMGQPRT
jgi:hypothetical protein